MLNPIEWKEQRKLSCALIPESDSAPHSKAEEKKQYVYPVLFEKGKLHTTTTIRLLLQEAKEEESPVC